MSRLPLAALGAALALFLLPAQAQTAGERLSLSRVGETLEPRERDYFRLFPAVPAAERLAIVWTSTDSLRVVRADGSGDTGVRLSAEQARLLERYVTEYEALFEPRRRVPWAGALGGLVRWRQPFRSPTPVTVARRDGPPLTGEVLYADEDVLLLAPPGAEGPSRFSFLTGEGRAVAVRAADVLRVFHSAPISRLDLRPGGDRGRYARTALPRLRRLAAFYGAAPPELYAEAQDVAEASQPTPSAPDARLLRRPLTPYQASFSSHAGQLDAGSTSTTLFGGTRVTDEWAGPVQGFAAKAEIGLTRLLGAGASVYVFAAEGMTGEGLNSLGYDAIGSTVYARAYLLPPQLDRIYLPAVALRAGATLARATSTARLESQFLPAFAAEPETFTSSAVRPGVTAGADVSFRLLRAISADAGYTFTLVTGLPEGEWFLPDARPGVSRQKTVEARTAALRSSSLTAGLSVHF